MEIALAPLLIGLIVIILAVALWFVAEGVARLIGSSVPFVGGAIASAIRSAIAPVAGWFLTAQDAAVSSLAWFLSEAVNRLWAPLYWLDQAVIKTATLAYRAERHALDLAAAVPAEVAAGVSAAESFAHAQVVFAAGILSGEITALHNTALSWVAGAVTTTEVYANGLFRTAEAGIASAEAAAAAAAGALSGRITMLEQVVAGDVAGLVANMKADLNIAVATALADAQAAEQTAITVAGQATASAIATTEQALNQAAHDLVLGPWTALLPELAPLVGALTPAQVGALGLPGVLTDPVPLSLPAILGLVVPVVGALTTEVSDCLVPNCRAVKSLGGLFNGLESVGVAGLLMALAAQAVADPGRAADEVASAGSWVEGLLSGLTDAVLG